MRSSLGVLSVVFILIQALPGLVPAQEKQGPVLGRPLNATEARSGQQPRSPLAASRGVHLQIDGNLVGQISIAGSTKPGHAQVNFVQRGNLIATAQSDEFGRFQITGLTPGIYSIGAKGSNGVALLAVPVLPFEANAPGEESILKLKLIPQTDYELLPKAARKAGPTIVVKPSKSASASPLTPLLGIGASGAAGKSGPALGVGGLGANIGGATGASRVGTAGDQLKSQTDPLGTRGTDNVTSGGSTAASAP
jgi:hypothetical protein